jgi:hypothetical protein
MMNARKSKGWFSCNKKCQFYKTDYEIALKEYNFQRKEEQRIIADAKSSVGIFSSYGIDETRGLFWTRFANGREFAQKQTKWDALFMGNHYAFCCLLSIFSFLFLICIPVPVLYRYQYLSLIFCPIFS